MPRPRDLRAFSLPLSDATIPGNLFILGKAGITAAFKNLYLLALATNNTANAAGVAMQVSADNVRLIVDNCVFDGWLGFAMGYSGNWDDFFVTNSDFRNLVHPNQWYVGEVLRNEWPSEAYTDTISFKYNVMSCINGYAAAPVTKVLYTLLRICREQSRFHIQESFLHLHVDQCQDQ